MEGGGERDTSVLLSQSKSSEVRVSPRLQTKESFFTTQAPYLDQVVSHFALLSPDGVHLLLQADLHHVPDSVPRPPVLPGYQAGRGHSERPLGLINGGEELVPGQDERSGLSCQVSSPRLHQELRLPQDGVQLSLQLRPPVVRVSQFLLQPEVGILLRALSRSANLGRVD